MFSGIIRGLGTVVSVQPDQGGVSIWVRLPEGWDAPGLGASICLNGVCLTVAQEKPVAATVTAVRFDAVGATLQRTRLGSLVQGTRVNLEPSLRLGDPLDGHWVTGHVDGVGAVTSRTTSEGAAFFSIAAPRELTPEIVPRGSIAVDGVSLTVAAKEGLQFQVSVVPYTLEETILDEYEPGRKVHLETDVLAKYVNGAHLGARPVPAAELVAPGRRNQDEQDG